MAAYKMKEKRRYPRLSDGAQVIYKFMGVFGEKKDDAVDFSQGGLRLLLKERTKPGVLLELGVLLPQSDDPFFALAKVVWQSEKRKLAKDKQLYYETGIEFLKMDMQHKMLMIKYIYKRLKKEQAV
jgi:c-di-GMP-binding flagellar brake protein YcgR